MAKKGSKKVKKVEGEDVTEVSVTPAPKAPVNAVLTHAERNAKRRRCDY